MTHCVVSAGAIRTLSGGVGLGDGNARSAAMVVGVAELRFTEPMLVSVPVLTDQRSTPQLCGTGLGDVHAKVELNHAVSAADRCGGIAS